MRQREIADTEGMVAITEEKEGLERTLWAVNRTVDQKKSKSTQQQTIDDHMRLKRLGLQDELKEQQRSVQEYTLEKDKMQKEILVLKKLRRDQNEERASLNLKLLQLEQLCVQGKSNLVRKEREWRECKELNKNLSSK